MATTLNELYDFLAQEGKDISPSFPNGVFDQPLCVVFRLHSNDGYTYYKTAWESMRRIIQVIDYSELGVRFSLVGRFTGSNKPRSESPMWALQLEPLKREVIAVPDYQPMKYRNVNEEMVRTGREG